MKLLTSNAKLMKDNGRNYYVLGLQLAPNTLGGMAVCSHSTPGCVAACVLWYVGRTVMPQVRDAMLARKKWLNEDREGFEAQLCKEIAAHERHCAKHGLSPAVRLNVASDLDWRHVVAKFPGVSFYDYTKVPDRLAVRPDNYELTYSVNERTHWRTPSAHLERGGNVAVVFSTRYSGQHKIYGKLPDEHTIAKKNYRVVDGDKHDVRLKDLDGEGVVVGLRFKGSLERRQRAIADGFCVDVGDGL